MTNFRIDPNDPSKDIIMERTKNIEEQNFMKIKRNQRRIHGICSEMDRVGNNAEM